MKIALIGYGKMGREIETLAASSGHEITGRFNSASRVSAEGLATCDVAIDFSSPEALTPNLTAALKANRPLVVGTTGWSGREAEVRERVIEAGGSLLYASNFSIGIQIFLKLVREAASIADRFETYDLFIHEYHHRQKKDSPSGTALTLAGVIKDAVKRKSKIETDAADGTIQPEVLHVSSTRAGSIPGTHIVGLDSPADTIELKHTARNRSGFAAGAIAGAQWIARNKGFHNFADIFPGLTS